MEKSPDSGLFFWPGAHRVTASHPVSNLLTNTERWFTGLQFKVKAIEDRVSYRTSYSMNYLAVIF